jgi:hypothetical protein
MRRGQDPNVRSGPPAWSRVDYLRSSVAEIAYDPSLLRQTLTWFLEAVALLGVLLSISVLLSIPLDFGSATAVLATSVLAVVVTSLLSFVSWNREAKSEHLDIKVGREHLELSGPATQEEVDRIVQAMVEDSRRGSDRPTSSERPPESDVSPEPNGG